MPFKIEGPLLALSPTDCQRLSAVVEGRLRHLTERGGGDPDELHLLQLVLRTAALGLVEDVIAERSAVSRQSSAMAADSGRLPAVVDVAAATRRLRLSESGRRVRQLLTDDGSPLRGERVNGQWHIDAASLDAEAARRRL